MSVEFAGWFLRNMVEKYRAFGLFCLIYADCAMFALTIAQWIRS